MQINYIIEECECSRAQIAVTDEDGEDCNLFEKLREYQAEIELCDKCLKAHTYRVAYQEDK